MARLFPRFYLLSSLIVLAAYAPGQANVLTMESYVQPPKTIADLVLAPRHTQVSLSNLSPDRERFLRAVGDGMPRIGLLSRPYVNLGGEMIDTTANRDRSLNYRSSVGLQVFNWSTGKWSDIVVPAEARVSGADWSPDGKSISYFAHFDKGSFIYIADVATGKSRRLGNKPVLLTLASSMTWVDGGKKIMAVFVPDNRGPEPKQNGEPTQPIVRVTENVRNRQRTHRALLGETFHQTQLEYYITGQLASIDAGNGSIKKIGKPSLIRSFNPSPDGKFVRVTSVLKPFSYLVPVGSFGSIEELWDEEGKAVAELSKRELRFGEEPPAAGGAGAAGAQNPNDKRSLSWRPDGQGMSFLQIEPAPARAGGAGTTTTGGDGGTGGGTGTTTGGGDEQGRGGGGQRGGGTGGDALPPGRKDRVMQWLPPYGKDNVKVIYESDTRIGSVRYSADCQTLYLTGTQAGNSVLYAVKLSNPTEKKTISSFRPDDFYKAPGDLMMTQNALGNSVVLTSADGGTVYLSGTQYFENPEKDAPRPFIDSVAVSSGDKKRIWQSSPDRFETVGAVLDKEGLRNVVVSRQSATMPANQFLVDLDTKVEKALTTNADLMPEVTRAQRYRVLVTRPDGFKFWAKVTTPASHVKGNKLPAMFWFYPREFTDQRAYDQSNRTYNRNTYISTSPMSLEYLVTLGYAVIQPDAPIVGPSGRMNDAYVPDLRNNLSATIDELERQGIIDRQRLAVGGHSYGAFSAANAMVHTPFFKAGIAGDGAYNRTLTPMAFQSESRLFWEAREMYLTMSPMLYADQMTGALLMYHGLDDQNVGTDPINSIRMFHSLMGLGKTASMYLYPYEDHGPAAKETYLDMWARWVAWLDKYVLNAGK